jgi:hypothetical protein
MFYAADMPQHNNDQVTGMSNGIRATVEEAAKLLGLSENAVRKRIERGTLRSEKVDDIRYVLLDGAMPQHALNMPTDISLMQAHLDSMQEQLSYLKAVIHTRDEEIRRKDHLLAATLERIPAIEASPDTPSESRESPVADTEPRSDTPKAPPQREKRSWWRRLIVG